MTTCPRPTLLHHATNNSLRSSHSSPGQLLHILKTLLVHHSSRRSSMAAQSNGEPAKHARNASILLATCGASAFLSHLNAHSMPSRWPEWWSTPATSTTEAPMRRCLLVLPVCVLQADSRISWSCGAGRSHLCVPWHHTSGKRLFPYNGIPLRDPNQHIMNNSP